MDDLKPLDIKCPDCGMNKGIWCVYIPPKAPVGTAAWVVQNERAGLPTKRLHNGRHNQVYHMNRARRRKASEAEWAARHAASPERATILRANAEAVAQEQRDLIQWLSRNVGILL
jgi:acyl-CoA reductase-like NAD-dependent aldehyde dehydrogenase